MTNMVSHRLGISSSLTRYLVVLTIRYVCYLASLTSLATAFNDNDDHCSWLGSGAVSRSEDSVRVVYLSCVEGRLVWKYPEGALLVHLRKPPLPADTSENFYRRSWTTCIRALSKHRGAAVFRLNKSNLTMVVPSNPVNVDAEFCFETPNYHEEVILYVEKDPTLDQHRSLAGFYYSTTPVVLHQTSSASSMSRRPKRSATVVRGDNALVRDATGDRSAAEQKVPERDRCRPCSDDELVDAFCTSELVFKGQIVGADKTMRRGDGTLRFKVDRLFRRPVDHDEFLVASPTAASPSKRRAAFEASLLVPGECFTDEQASPATAHHYLVLANVRLGRAEVNCLPLFDDWLELKGRLVRENRVSTVCDLDA